VMGCEIMPAPRLSNKALVRFEHIHGPTFASKHKSRGKSTYRATHYGCSKISFRHKFSFGMDLFTVGLECAERLFEEARNAA
jgi:hypothetical protein